MRYFAYRLGLIQIAGMAANITKMFTYLDNFDSSHLKIYVNININILSHPSSFSLGFASESEPTKNKP